MPAAEPVLDVQVKCHCCDTVFLFSSKVLATMKLPSTFCLRCFHFYPPLTLRKWFVVDMLYRQVQMHEGRLTRAGLQ